ncbi:DUF1648 domain-containing protein [Candidatus Falkowbacteria bacterium]|nr:DUF1648 domain-containing protein [Candidatus Falkowbacteria bacterium]
MTNPIKLSLKTELVIIILILLNIGAAFWFYAHTPEQIPTHWNTAGEIDGYSSRAFGATFLPALTIGIYLLLILLPYLDPKRDRYQEFANIYFIFYDSLFCYRFYWSRV